MRALLPLLLVACVAPEGEPHDVAALPPPDAWGSTEGPGIPAVSFPEEALYEPCGVVLGGPGDAEHHNLLSMHDGWLVHPWAPESGGGGVSLLDLSDPCDPVVVGQVWSDFMRETHTLAIGRVGDRELLAVDYIEPREDGGITTVGGVGLIDITDRANPYWLSHLATPNFAYPDSYLRVTFSNFFQGNLVFVSAGFNGVHVVDVSDPEAPELLHTYTFDPPHLVGQLTVIGNLAVAQAASTAAVVILDVSDPLDAQLVSTFDTVDGDGEVHKYYFSSVAGRYGVFARNDRGGGPIVYDLSDPSNPTWVGELHTPDGDGGYVYRQNDRLLQGDSNFGVFMDFSDPTAPTELARVYTPGDVDTISPIGHLAVVSVDSGARPGEASRIVPFRPEPDSIPPTPELFSPPPGATHQALTSRIGVAFDEWIEGVSVFEGSFRVADARGRPVPGTFNVQENVVNFTPAQPLEPDTTYFVSLPAGGIVDYSGNAVAEAVGWSFRTGSP